MPAAWAMNIGPTGASLGTVTIATDGTITLAAHGLADGDAVAFDTLTGGAVGAIEEGEAYYVRNKTTDTLQVSGSRGGALLTFADTGGAAIYSANPGYPAETLRQLDSHLMFHGSANRLGARQGVRPGGGDPISVSGTTWTVETHTGTVEPAETTTQGPYSYVCLETTGDLDPADVSNTRIDALDLLIEDDDADATSFRRARVVYTAGTASGTPAAPTALDNALRLGTITVPAAGSAEVDTLAPWTVASGGVLPVRDETERPTTGRYPGMVIYQIDTDTLLVWDGSTWAELASQANNDYVSAMTSGTQSAVGWNVYSPTVTGGGSATFSARTGRWKRTAPQCVDFIVFLEVSSAGSGTDNVQVDMPTDINRATRQTAQLSIEGAAGGGGSLRSGYAVSLTSQAGPTWDRLRFADGVDSHLDNLTGAALASGMLISIQGFYQEET